MFRAMMIALLLTKVGSSAIAQTNLVLNGDFELQSGCLRLGAYPISKQHCPGAVSHAPECAQAYVAYAQCPAIEKAAALLG
jgi:hypothetical protein